MADGASRRTLARHESRNARATPAAREDRARRCSQDPRRQLHRGFSSDSAPLCQREAPARRRAVTTARKDETSPVTGRRARRCADWSRSAGGGSAARRSRAARSATLHIRGPVAGAVPRVCTRQNDSQALPANGALRLLRHLVKPAAGARELLANSAARGRLLRIAGLSLELSIRKALSSMEVLQ